MERDDDDDDDDIPTPDTNYSNSQMDLSSPDTQTNPSEILPPGLCAWKLI